MSHACHSVMDTRRRRSNLESISLLEQALEPRAPVEKFPGNMHLEEVELDEVDQRQRERAAAEDAMDEDDDQPRVQCANQ